MTGLTLFKDFFTFDPDYLFFDRPTKDMYPWQAVSKDGKLILVGNMLGISEDNVSIKVENAINSKGQYLTVSGKTKNEVLGKEYNFSSSLYMHKPIEKIDWYMKDGLITLEIQFQEPVKPSVTINRK